MDGGVLSLNPEATDTWTRLLVEARLVKSAFGSGKCFRALISSEWIMIRNDYLSIIAELVYPFILNVRYESSVRILRNTQNQVIPLPPNSPNLNPFASFIKETTELQDTLKPARADTR